MGWNKDGVDIFFGPPGYTNYPITKSKAKNGMLQVAGVWVG